MKKTTTISRAVLRRTIAVLRLGSNKGRAHDLLLLIVALFSLLAPLRAQLSSSPGILLGDFNGDGIQDALIPSASAGTLTLTFGSVPFGSFGASARSIPAPTGCLQIVSSAIVVGDFNNDGLSDIALTCVSTLSTSNYGIYIMLGVGDGSFTTKPAIAGLSNLVSGDFNHDGKLDLAAIGSTGGNNQYIYFLPGNGDGTFGAATTSFLSNIVYSSALAVDLNGDGVPELALGSFASQANIVDIYVFNQSGTFGVISTVSSPNASIDAGAYPASADVAIIAGNFYGSGLSDLAVVDTGTTPGVFVIQNNSTDGFSFGTAAKTAFAGLTGAVSASFTSSLSDLLVSNGTALSVLANNGSGGFAATYAGLAAPSTSTLFAAADANGDGHADIYTAALTATGASLTVNLVSGTASATSQPFSLPAGTIPVTAAWQGNLNFSGSTLNGKQVVGGISPIVTWPAPAAIPYGTPLSATQLDATAATAAGVAVPGTFVYTPAAGTVLGVGTHTLNVTFTPTDLVTYTVATGTVSLLVNQEAPALAWTPTVASIPYGTALGAAQLDAVATGVGGVTIPGTFVYTPAAGTVPGAGAQTLSVVFTPTDPVNYLVARATTQINVTQAVPTIAWASPASIAYGVALGATQLDATATGVTGAPLPGTFAYTPAAGTVLAPGVQTLSTTFTPADAVDYAVGVATVKITVSDVTLSSFTPSSAPLASPDTTITITGSGIVGTTIVLVNGSPVATTVVNPATLTAVIPAADFLVPGTLQITLKNPTTGSVSGAVAFTITAPSLSGTLSGPPTTSPGTQPVLTFTIPPYPVDLTATLTVSLKSSIGSGATDAQNVVFANGSDTFSFVIKAGTTIIPPIPLAAGTVAETITVTPTLFIGTTDVTPAGLAPVVINVPAAVPQGMSTTLTRSGNQLTVTIIGFSNTREIVSAAFHFTPISGATLVQPDVSPEVGGTFASWYDGDTSLNYGSSFTYIQVFNVSDTAANIGSVQVTLTNTVGASAVETAQ